MSWMQIEFYWRYTCIVSVHDCCLRRPLMVSIVLAGITIFLDMFVKTPEHPAPMTGEHATVLVLHDDCTCELENPAVLEQVNCQEIEKLGIANKNRLEDLLVKLASDKSYKNLFRMLVRSLAEHLEQTIIAADGDEDTVNMQDSDEGPARGNDMRLDQKLLKHVLAAKNESMIEANRGFMSVGVDKSRVGSFGMQVACGVLPNNSAFIMPPCVASSVAVR